MPVSLDQFISFKNELPEKVTLVAVSKTKPVSDLEEFYSYGQKDFGENKAQELCEKHNKLPKDINWHMIGHLQRNKVKFIVEVNRNPNENDFNGKKQ